MECWEIKTPHGTETVTVIKKDIKNIYLRMRHGAFVLTMPKKGSVGRARRFLEERSAWMAEKRTQGSGKQWYTADKILLFGCYYPVTKREGVRARLTFSGEQFLYSGKEEGYKRTVLAYLKSCGIRYSKERAEQYAERYPEYKGILVAVRTMVSMWGNYNRKKRLITCNTKLFCAPKRCVDMVIFHELCHSGEANHGKNFYSLLVREFPDYKLLRKKLNEIKLREE